MPFRRNQAVAVRPRFVRLRIPGFQQALGVPQRDASYTYLTLGNQNPVSQGPRKDAAYSRWVVSGAPRQNGRNLNRADAHYNHVSPWV